MQLWWERLGGLLQQYNNPQGYLMIGLFLGLVVLSMVLGDSKGKITTGRLAGRTEKLAATTTALKQLRLPLNYKAPRHLKPGKSKKPLSLAKTSPSTVPANRVTFWVGKMPQFWWGGRFRSIGAWLQTLLGAMPAVWIPDAQRSVFVVGSPGSGKTASAIDRMVESALAQGIPVLLYDKKGDVRFVG